MPAPPPGGASQPPPPGGPTPYSPPASAPALPATPTRQPVSPPTPTETAAAAPSPTAEPAVSAPSTPGAPGSLRYWPGRFAMQSSGSPIVLAPRFPGRPTPAAAPGVKPTAQAVYENQPALPAAQFGLRAGQYAAHGSGTALATPAIRFPGQPAGSPEPLETEAGLTTPEAPLTATLPLTATSQLPSATPYLTPTPTITPTPSITPTPPPPPAWMYTRLPATDPLTVVLASGKPQLILFFAYWSGPSQAMSPIVEGLQAEFGDRVTFTYLDIDDPATQELKDSLGFSMEPQFFLLDKDGHIVRQWSGPVTVEELRQALTEAAVP